MTLRTYTCAGCGGTFETERDLAEAEADFHREFGNAPSGREARVCEDCYGEIMAAARQRGHQPGRPLSEARLLVIQMKPAGYGQCVRCQKEDVLKEWSGVKRALSDGTMIPFRVCRACIFELMAANHRADVDG